MEQVTVLVPEERLAEFYRMFSEWLSRGQEDPHDLASATISRSSRYAPFHHFLAQQPNDKRTLHLTFEEVETALKGDLPKSARQHRPWWANTRHRTNVQAASWLSAGWKVDEVDLDREIVTFERLQAGE